MKYTIIPPCDKLKDLVSHFWTGTWDTTLQKPNATYYVIANSLTEIIFAFNGSNKNSDLLFSTVQGHTYLPNQFSVEGFYHLVGVSFHSYAIPNFFNIPSTELNKEFIPLTTFLGYEGEILKERIALATGTKQRIKILSDYFISALEKNNYGDKQITAAINEIKRYNGSIKIEELASDFSLSQKQFGRRFKEFSGFSPKMYSRIIRFESVIKNYQNISNITKIAFTDGYYDQAHFIHEVKSFTGYSPKDFWKLSDENS